MPDPVVPCSFTHPMTLYAIDRYNAETAPRRPSAEAAALAARIRGLARSACSVRLSPSSMVIAAGTLLQVASALERGVSIARCTEVLGNALTSAGLGADGRRAATAVFAHIAAIDMLFTDASATPTQMTVRY